MTQYEDKTYVTALCQVNPTKIDKTGNNISKWADTISYFF